MPAHSLQTQLAYYRKTWNLSPNRCKHFDDVAAIMAWESGDHEELRKFYGFATIQALADAANQAAKTTLHA